MALREWESARNDFFDAFKNYDEAGIGRRIQCLKYLILANMLMNSDISPFDSQVTKRPSNIFIYILIVHLYLQSIKFSFILGVHLYIQCLKYLVLANMLMNSDISPFDSQVANQSSNRFIYILIVHLYMQSIKFSYILSGRLYVQCLNSSSSLTC